MERLPRVIYSCKMASCESKCYRNNPGRNKRFYKFPADEHKQLQWKIVCGIHLNAHVQNFRVCENHFVDSDFLNTMKHKLSPSAVPKILQSARSNVCVPGTSAGTTKDSELLTDTVESSTCHLPDTSTPAVENDYSFLNQSFSSKQKKEYLQNLGVKETELSPKKRWMYQVHRSTMSRMSRLKIQMKKERDQSRKLKELYVQSQFDVIETSLNSINQEFIKSQLKNSGRKPNAKRYSQNFKIFSLSMYKRSPRLYRYLRLHFELPSPRLLKQILHAIPFDTGFNNSLLQSLKAQVEEMNPLDRFCSILFDEIKLSDSFHYDRCKQLIFGFEDLGHLGRSMKCADHALVFMARGLRKKWKQPIGYFFTSGTIQTVNLKQIVFKAVELLQSIGLIPIASVCDQGPTNRSAVNMLCRDFVKDTPSMTHFEVGNESVNCVFDVCHLLKNTRNALIENAIVFEGNKAAKMEHIQMAFALDHVKKIPTLYKLCSENFNFGNSFNKMKVNVAARQLSRTVAAVLETYLSFNALPAEAAHTAEFVELVDNLFDSLNGSTKFSENQNKQFKCALSAESPHLNFWQEILPKIAKWKIINLKTGKDVTNQFSFINGWQVTIRSVISIWRRLHTAGYVYLCPRLLNQDPLENLFCCVRQHGISNTNPNSYQFVAALKTCVINNLVLTRNSGNCENDEETLLNNLSAFVKSSNEDDNFQPGSFTQDVASMDDIAFSDNIVREDSQGLAYVAGYILKKMYLPDCPSCKADLFADTKTSAHLYTSFKEGDDQERLTYASEKFMLLFQNTNLLLETFLKKNAHQQCLQDTLIIYGKNSVLTSHFTCPEHRTDLCSEYLSAAVPFLIYKYVNSLNKGSKETLRKSLQKHLRKVKQFQS